MHSSRFIFITCLHHTSGTSIIHLFTARCGIGVQISHVCATQGGQYSFVHYGEVIQHVLLGILVILLHSIFYSFKIGQGYIIMCRSNWN